MERRIDRFDKFMIYKGLNDNKVTIELGLSNGTLGKSRKPGRDLSNRLIEEILEKYNEINNIWLLTGEGPMLKTDVVDQVGSCTYITPKEVAAELEFVKNQLKEKDKVIGALNQEIGRLKATIEMYQKEKDCQ